jgi:hypothetical protein
MPVSVPTSCASWVAFSAIDVVAPGGATSIQRLVGLMGASSRFSKPSVSVKNASARSWSLTSMAMVRTSVIVVM